MDAREHLPLGQDVLAAGDADRHERHAELEGEEGGAVEHRRDLGTGTAGALGEHRNRGTLRERGLERTEGGAVGRAPLDLHRAERVEELRAQPVLPEVVLGQEADLARGDERGERDVEDRAV